MKTVIRNTQLREKFESGIHLVLRPRNSVGLPVPGKQFCTRTKGVSAGIAEGMPVANGIAQMILHGFAAYHLVFVVPFIRKRVIAFRSFVLDFPDAWKKFFAA
jgi:hypothetical protein